MAVTYAPSTFPATRLVRQLDLFARHSGARLVFIPHERLPLPDLGVADKLTKALDTRLESIPLVPAREVVWWTSHASMVISTRYYPLVFGCSAAVPCLGIYEDNYTRVKTRGALTWWELEEGSLPIELSEGTLGRAAVELWERPEEIKAHLENRRLWLQSAWESHPEAVVAALDGGDDGMARDDQLLSAPGLGPLPDDSWRLLASRLNDRFERLTEELWHHQLSAIA